MSECSSPSSSPPRDRVGEVRWWIYLLDCDGQALYTGITTDPDRRLNQHRNGRGARSLRRFRQLELAYALPVGSRSLALQVEYRIKQLSRSAKRRLLREAPGRLALLTQLGLAAASQPTTTPAGPAPSPTAPPRGSACS